jgi:hypothetical protein
MIALFEEWRCISKNLANYSKGETGDRGIHPATHLAMGEPMKLTHVKSIVMAAVAAGILSVGCSVYVHEPAGEVEVTSAPPPAAEVDVQGVAPGPGYVWVGGEWTWGPGGHWVWARGHWGRPPHAGAVWEPSRYEFRGGRHVFVHGRWR